MQLRKGKTKSILESSIESALLAVEIYNKPRTAFRSEGFITLMVIAWTKFFHAYFYTTIGDKYYYKNKSGRYETIDGERKTWELSTCIKKYGVLTESVKKSLRFFILLRNKIEHSHVAKNEIDTMIFGECQSLLYNYENIIIGFFGEEYAIHESLVYSLQFSHLRTKQQNISNKSALSKDMADLVGFITRFRNNLEENTYSSQEYSIKLIQIPKVSNTNRSDAAIEFLRWDQLSEEEKLIVEHLVVIVKDKTEHVEASNVKKYKPSQVVSEVKLRISTTFNITTNLHAIIYKLFRIRPLKGADDPFDTETEFCLYDETHDDYVYKEAWIEFLVQFIEISGFSPRELRNKYNNNEILKIENFRTN